LHIREKYFKSINCILRHILLSFTRLGRYKKSTLGQQCYDVKNDKESLIVKVGGAFGTLLGKLYSKSKPYAKKSAVFVAEKAYDGLGKLTGNPTCKEQEKTVYVSDVAKGILISVVKKHGTPDMTDKAKYENLLSDYFAEDWKREKNALVAAMNFGIVSDIIKILKVADKEDLRKLSNRLDHDFGISKDIAIWAVDAWYSALKHADK